MQTIKLSIKQKEGLETFITDHMMACRFFLDNTENENFQPYDSRYCGCDVCETKEYLMATFDYLERSGILRIE